MVTLQPITPIIAATFKEVRLRALLDTPSAFGSTHANELQISDADWQNRAAQWSGERSAGYLAFDGQVACGIAAGFLNSKDPAKAHLVSMWVAPTHRKRGVGKQLVNAVIEWARCKHASTLCLMVTSNNEVAEQFYQRLGFVRSGRTEPYPNDPALVEYEMARPIDRALPDPESSLDQAINEPVTIVPYNPAWPSLFELERARLAEFLPQQIFVEHIGSTAVPGMPAKPIIDCMAAVASMEVADRMVDLLCANGYTTSAEFNLSLGDRRWLMRHAEGRRTHHLHLVLIQSSHLADSIRFRDGLHADGRLASEYAELKYRLAGSLGSDREAYTTAKAAFIAAALRVDHD